MDRDRDGRSRRYDDGEVVRYGAGESWRPTPRGGERSPRRVRSPVRDRGRTPPRARSPRPRSPIIAGSDSYVPGRYPPRRRSRSGGGDRYRRERSRDRESPRRRERSRSPLRRSPPRRSPPRRDSPNRYERPRSPMRRDWDRDRDRDWDRDRNNRMRDRELDRRDDRRSRSPFNRDRRRTPPGRSTPLAVRGGVSYRPRSPSANRRGGDRYQSYRRPTPPRESGLSSVMTSRPASERASPRPHSTKGRSPPELPAQPSTREGTPRHAGADTATSTAPPTAAATPVSARDRDTPKPDVAPQSQSRSPPRGPAALRAPPTGPAANRTQATPTPTPATAQRYPQTPSTAHRPDVSPTNPPSGPRGYVVQPSRIGFPQPRGGWGGSSSGNSNSSSSSSSQTRPLPGHAAGSPPTAQGAVGAPPPASIPTGPRATPPNVPGPGGPSASLSRPFNPPTGPSAQHAGGPRQTLAQSLLGTMPPIVPGGKLDPGMAPLVHGVTRDVEPHFRKLRDEEEKIREEMRARQERLRKGLYTWNRMERDARSWEMRSDLSEKSMKNLAGEGIGGAAF